MTVSGIPGNPAEFSFKHHSATVKEISDGRSNGNKNMKKEEDLEECCLLLFHYKSKYRCKRNSPRSLLFYFLCYYHLANLLRVQMLTTGLHLMVEWLED